MQRLCAFGSALRSCLPVYVSFGMITAMMKTAHWIVLGALILQAGLSGCSKKQDQPQTDRPPVADTAEAKTEATRFAEAASEAVRQSRQRRATAIRGVVQTGLETYHAQKDQWPGTVDSLESGIVPDELAQTMIRTIVTETVRNGNPLLDVGGLYVADAAKGFAETGCGLDFRVAVKERKMSVMYMYYGYPDADTGRFRLLRLEYDCGKDSILVR